MNGGQGGVEEKLLGTGEISFEARVGGTSCPPDALGQMVTSPVNDDNKDKYKMGGSDVASKALAFLREKRGKVEATTEQGGDQP